MRSIAITYLLLIGLAASTSQAAQPWEQSLQGKSEQTRRAITSLCEEKAKEEIYETVNGVSSFYLTTKDRSVSILPNFSSRMDGVSYTIPWYQFFRLGLKEIEVAPIFELRDVTPLGNHNNLPVAVFNLGNRTASYIAAPTASLEISYERATTEQEQSEYGVYGRTISVIDRASQKTLATRTEFWWFRVSGRQRIWTRDSICPAFREKNEFLPQAFFSRVINPLSYTCLRTYFADLTALESKYSELRRPFVFTDPRLLSISGDQVREESALQKALDQCQRDFDRGK